MTFEVAQVGAELRRGKRRKTVTIGCGKKSSMKSRKKYWEVCHGGMTRLYCMKGLTDSGVEVAKESRVDGAKSTIYKLSMFQIECTTLGASKGLPRQTTSMLGLPEGVAVAMDIATRDEWDHSLTSM